MSASPTLQVAAEAERLRRAGFDVVDFSAGEPDFPTPAHVKTAGKAAIDANFTRYTVASGIPELREAICARYRQDYGVDIAPTEVLVTVGGKQALFNAAAALFDEGDEVITHAPYWPTIPEQVKLMGATPVIVTTRSDDGFAVHAEAIIGAITPKTKAIILNSPSNPTGALIDEGTVAAIADAAAARGIWIIVDLCYEQLVYDPVPHNLPKVLFARHRDRTVLAGSASKGYAMTGWRCGWSIAPKDVTAAFNVILGQSTSNITSITQKAALAALKGPQDAVFEMLDEYRIAARQHSRLVDCPSGDRLPEAEGRLLSSCPTSRDCCRPTAFVRPLSLPRHSSRARRSSWCRVRRSMHPDTSAFRTRRRSSDCAKGRRACFASSNRCNRPAPARRTDRVHNLS